jgi:hypothetical protein
MVSMNYIFILLSTIKIYIFEGTKNVILGTMISFKRSLPNWRSQTLMNQGFPKPYDKNDRMVSKDEILEQLDIKGNKVEEIQRYRLLQEPYQMMNIIVDVERGYN